MLDVETVSIREAIADFEKAGVRLDDMRQPLKLLAQGFHAEYQKSMTSGKDPDGKKLAPVAKWTRLAGRSRGTRFKGKLIPLVNTGRLRASMKVRRLTKHQVHIGWGGKQHEIASRMINGTAGTMGVRQKGIKKQYSGIRATKKSGNQAGARHFYLRVKNGDKWMTRQVKNRAIRIKPQARDFFYLTTAQIKKTEKDIADWAVEQVVDK